MRGSAGWTVILALWLAGCGSAGEIETGVDDPADDETQEGGDVLPGALPTFPNTGVNATTLTVTGIKPSSGPFSGRNRAVVRGSGFTEDALVFVDGRMVQPAETILEDRNSLAIVLPAGRAGNVDISVRIGEEEVTKRNAYTYNPLKVEPITGSIAGGTAVTVELDGAELDEGAVVSFGDEACTALRVITPSLLRCKTPPGDVGKVDVTISWPFEPEREPIVARAAYEFLDLTDTDQGGLSGGSIEGTVNVTVIDNQIGLAIPGAYVLLGDELDGEYQGRTNKRGQITFSGDELTGPISIHVAAKCMKRTSIIAFDATNVTVFLQPLLDPSCAMEGDPPSGNSRGTAGALISGELIFPGGVEFLVNSWDKIPEPRENEIRVAYVFTTQLSVEIPNPSPAVGGGYARIAEESSPIGTRGYPYRIFARPGGLAVYAISGLERRDTGEFIPYLMGVTRDVLTAPGDETIDIDIEMTIPLDRELQLKFENIPERAPRGPDEFRTRVDLDLGGQGLIVREISNRLFDVATSYTGGGLFRFFAQPALIGTLADARYQVIGGWYSGDRGNAPPLTELRKQGVMQGNEPFVIDDLLSIPSVVAPLEGGRIPADRILRWDIAGDEPDMWLVEIVGGDGVPSWIQIVPGHERQSTIPDLTPIEEIGDIASGVIQWSVQAIKVEGFKFNELKYNQLSPRHWSHTSIDSFTMQR